VSAPISFHFSAKIQSGADTPLSEEKLMWSFTRRQFCGLLAATAFAGCSQPKPVDLPLPMGPPVEKPVKSADSSGGDVPETFQVKLETTKGEVVIEVHRDWSPHGAARFYELVKIGFYDDCRFFRVIRQPEDFMVQWGIHGDPKVMDKWRDNNIPDDQPTGENRQSNLRGYVTFAKAGFPNSRSTQIFVNYTDNSRLDPQGFTPFGKVLSGMDTLESLNSKYGESASQQQGRIQKEGNAFLDKAFPGLDSITKASLIDTNSAATDEAKPTQDAPSDDSKSKEGEKP
jgi:peptidyl-prolyl cis-trans isomerase A (cyclophilin A)